MTDLQQLAIARLTDPLFIGALLYASIVIGAMCGAYMGIAAFFLSEDRRADARKSLDKVAYDHHTEPHAPR